MKIERIQGSRWNKIQDNYIIHSFIIIDEQIIGTYRRVSGKKGAKLVCHKMTKQEKICFMGTYGYHAALHNIFITEAGETYYLPGEIKKH